jgi:multidrug efflux pump subunit AcrA (membrane-fusion protein)
MRTALLSGILAGTGFLFSACGAPHEPVPQPRRIAAAVATAQYESVASLIEAPGSIQPRHRVVLASQIAGYVRAVHVRAGDLVRQGQVLATLDSRDADSQKSASEAAIQESRAALDEARKGALAAQSMRNAAQASSALAAVTFARFQKLHDTRSVSPQELDDVRSRRDAAAAELAARETMVAAAEDRVRQVEARIAQADAQSRRADVVLGWTVIRAPAAGVIVERPTDPGSVIFPGTPLLVLESTAAPQAIADLPSRDAAYLSPRLEVRVRGAGGPPVTGRIAEIVPVSSPASHTVQFKVDLPEDIAARSGEFVRIEIPAGNRRALLVPRKAVRETGQLTGVFVVGDGSRAQFRLVRLTDYDADRFEVLTGLEPGERIVMAPDNQIIDGTLLETR